MDVAIFSLAGAIALLSTRFICSEGPGTPRP